jgi:DNA-binding response OmpR family regulator
MGYKGPGGAMAVILLVEDDPDQRRLIEALLRHAKYEVRTAAHAEQAMLLLREGGVDLVFSDVNMPGMSGLEFCREVRGDPATEETYIILASAEEALDLKAAGESAGADDVLRKPFPSEEMLARVRVGVRVRTLLSHARELNQRLTQAKRRESAVARTLERVVQAMERAELLHQQGKAVEAFDLLHRTRNEARGQVPPGAWGATPPAAG